MKNAITSLFCCLLLLGCQKNQVPPETPQINNTPDTTSPDPQSPPTSDFRSAYTGNFMVHYVYWQSYNSTITNQLDTTYLINVTYQIGDSAGYRVPGTYEPPEFIRYPRLSVLLNGYNLFSFGVDADAMAAPSYHVDGVWHMSQSGGFITPDSINYTYHDSDPHTSLHCEVRGHRVP